MIRCRIRVLSENTASGLGIMGEHGLSFWIERGSKRILFDTGQGFVLENNARRLGIQLEDVDEVILSHGHYDHTGGLLPVLERSPSVPVFAHPKALEPKYAARTGRPGRYIGMPEETMRILKGSKSWMAVEEKTATPGGMILTGPIARRTPYEDTGGRFYLDEECQEEDPMKDDQAAYLDTPQGLVVLLGCAHAGIVNTLEAILEQTQGRPVHTVIGGAHLVNASKERIAKTTEHLRKLDVQDLRLAHCTGFEASCFLWNALPGRCSPLPAGSQMEFTLRSS